MLREDRTRRRVSEVDRLEQYFLVGRDLEMRLFARKLASTASPGGILNLFGTGGVGKSYLLHAYRRIAAEAQAKFVLLDCRVIPGNPSDFCRSLLHALHYPSNRIDQLTESSLLAEACLDALRETTANERTVLALDTFEALGDMERWLRDDFLARLDPDALVVIAGRFPLQGAWLASPAWRRLVERVPLGELDYEAVEHYLARSGIDQEEHVRRIWNRTKGHALTLSLLVSTTLAHSPQQSMPYGEQEVFAQVVSLWLQEVPDPQMRELVETAAVLRQFNQEMLSHVLERTVTTEQFRTLTGYSFVQKTERGWLLHDLLRDAVGFELRQRMPEFHNRLWKRSVLYCCNRMKLSAKKRSAAWENAEILYYIGNHFIQFLLFRQSISYSLEPLHPANWAEAEAYIERRLLTAKDGPFHVINHETKERMDFILSAVESLNVLKQIRLKELYELDPSCVKLIRNADGDVCGVFEIIPINMDTMDYLLSKPLSSAYFNHLSDAARRELMVPGHTKAGYFVKTLDVYDFTDASMMQASLSTFITHILTAGYIVAAPVENPISFAICSSIGLQPAEGVKHRDYDGETPTSYYVLDTRGNKIHDYLNKMIASFGMPVEEEPDYGQSAGMQVLSAREQEVAKLLMGGGSNREIARKLYLSESTVKKHVTNIFRKLEIKNRVQLINKLT